MSKDAMKHRIRFLAKQGLTCFARGAKQLTRIAMVLVSNALSRSREVDGCMILFNTGDSPMSYSYFIVTIKVRVKVLAIGVQAADRLRTFLVLYCIKYTSRFAASALQILSVMAL